MLYTRRELGKLALAALPAAALLPKELQAAARLQGKPNSKWAGVQVGMNMPYNLGTDAANHWYGNFTNGDEIIARCVQLGCSAVELRMQPVELFLESPEVVAAAATAATNAANRGRGAGGRQGGRGAAAADAAAPATAPAPAAAAGEPAAPAPARGGGRAAQTPEQQAAQKAAAEATRKWRLSVPMSKVREFRKKFNDAGVLIDIVKVDGIFGFSEEEIDYAFQLAQNLGARGLSTEISTVAQEADRLAAFKKVGQFADKHKMLIGYHGHTATGPKQWQEAFSQAKYNGANLDIGHYVGGNKTSPIPFLKEQHERITHIHVKDKTLQDVNVSFGQGDTPIKEALQAIRDNKWNIQATIEFEYPVPAGSDRMAEMAKCMEFCKAALLG